jgi:hypothetical protein
MDVSHKLHSPGIGGMGSNPPLPRGQGEPAISQLRMGESDGRFKLLHQESGSRIEMKTKIRKRSKSRSQIEIWTEWLRNSYS